MDPEVFFGSQNHAACFLHPRFCLPFWCDTGPPAAEISLVVHLPGKIQRLLIKCEVEELVHNKFVRNYLSQYVFVPRSNCFATYSV